MKFLGPVALQSPESMLTSEWRKPFNLSIGLHIAVVITAMLATTFFERQPRLPEIYTVNLFTATEVTVESPQAETPAAKQPEAQKIQEIEPEIKKPAISIQPAQQEIIPPAPKIVEPISLRPVKMKQKIGKTLEEEKVEKAKLSRVLNRIKASAAEKEAKERAEKAAKDAVSKLADALKATVPQAASTSVAKASGQSATRQKSAAISGPKGSGIEPDFYMKQYLSAVYQKIHDHWVLPDLQNWDNSLEAVLSVVIKRDGTMENSYFERKSDNIYFNQFVLKAMKEASPLPPFPDQLEEDILEIGLRFKPGELGY